MAMIKNNVIEFTTTDSMEFKDLTDEVEKIISRGRLFLGGMVSDCSLPLD
jgi:phage-related minor tail protein